jgi:hypothetical protein
MPSLRNLVGQQLGLLTVRERAPGNAWGNARWVCSCACDGKTVIVAGGHLTSGHTRSCGCLRRQVGARSINCIGQRFGWLVVLQSIGRNKHGQTLWLCRCDCKNEVVVTRNKLAGGRTKSCGCLHRERLSKGRVTHGMSKTREYRSYHLAKSRCTTIIGSPTTAGAG